VEVVPLLNRRVPKDPPPMFVAAQRDNQIRKCTGANRKEMHMKRTKLNETHSTGAGKGGTSALLTVATFWYPLEYLHGLGMRRITSGKAG
jgi:hypothetical protein